MTPPQDIRASDADRQRVADALSRYASEGRLTLDELTDRLEELYRLKTLGQLEADDGPLRELPPLYPPLVAHGAPSVWVDPNRLTSPPSPAPWPHSPARHMAPLVPWLLILFIVALSVGATSWAGDKGLWLLVAVAFIARGSFRHRGGHHHQHR